MYINVFYRPIVYEITFVITYFDAITTYSPVCKMSSAARKFCAGTLSRLTVVSREAKKKQHACASSGLRDHYSELFTRMAALKF